MQLNTKVFDILKNGTPAERKYVCEQEPIYFAIYYFTEFFIYPIPDFHKDFYNDIKRLISGELDEAAWIAFRESAKRQPLDAKILTPNGWKLMGEIKVNDEVIGSDGKPTKVEYVSEIVKRPVYRLKTEDGRETECDIEHLWTVRKMTNVKEKIVTITTKEILQSGLYYSRKPDYRNNKQYKEYKFAIDTVEPIVFKEKKLPIEPYFLGLWLGDGTSSSVDITNIDKEVEEYLSKYAERIKLKFKINNHNGDRTRTLSITRGYTGGINRFSLQNELRKLNLLNNKHIPEEYLFGSIEQRKALLEGLMDSDGTANSGTLSFSNKNERLINDTIKLIRSLGGRVKKSKRKTNCVYKGKKIISSCFSLSILFTDYTPFRIKRKKIAHQKSKHTFSRIISIERVGIKKGKCIKVSNIDGLYVTDDYLLTHNTSLAKIFVIWCICYKKKQFINYDSYDKTNAESALFDIAVWLQTNHKLIADFGQLYYKKTSDKEAKIKRINNFITENGVKVEAYSTQQSTRGRIFKEIRPDLYILDDIENNITKESFPITSKIKAHIDEMKSGLSTQGAILYLGNYITEEGVIAHVMEAIKRNPKGQLRFVPVEEKGKITWPDKYVKTDKEAIEANKGIKEREKWKVSLEAKRRSLGDSVYETEMMNNPAKSGDLVFNRRIMTELIKKAKKPLKEISDIKIWEEYDPSHSYGLGGDTSEGKSLDANAGVLINYSLRPARVVATFEDNKITPNLFAHVMANMGNMFGGCISAPEINNTGFATLAELQNIYDNIYIREAKGKVNPSASTEYGIRMTPGVKYDIIGNLKSAIENEELEVLDEGLLWEMYYYTKQALNAMKMQEGMTRHFDKLIACAIAWELRKHAVSNINSQQIIFEQNARQYQPNQDI